MRRSVTSRRIWAASLPLIFAGISETVVEVTDAIFLARYGITELAAVALADAIYAVLAVLAVGLADGLQVMVARRAGEDRPHRIGAVMTQSLWFLLAASLGLFAVLRWVVPSFTGWVLHSDEVRPAVDAFLQVIAFGVVFEAMNMAFGAFYVGISRTRVLAAATVILAVTNIVLDWLLIFGRAGLPELGIAGAAWASVAAEGAVFVFLTAHLFLRGHVARYRLFRFSSWDGALGRRLLALSSPVALEALVGASRWFVVFLIIEQLGEAALAVSNIAYSTYTVLLIPVAAFSETACTLVSRVIGEGRSHALREVLQKTVSLGYLVTLPCVGIVVLFPEAIVSLFTVDLTRHPEAMASVVVVALATLVVVPGEMTLSALVGTGDTTGAMLIELVVSALVVTYVSAVALAFSLSLPWVWLSVALGWTLRTVLSVTRLRSRRWVGVEV